MKRVWVLIAGLLILISGCTHMQQGAPDGMGGPVLDRIAKRGELLVGTAADMPPLNATTKDGKIIGLEPDLAELIAEAMDVKLRMVPMSFSDLLAAVGLTTLQKVLGTVLKTRIIDILRIGHATPCEVFDA